MKHQTKAILAAAFIVAFVAPTLAQSRMPNHNYRGAPITSQGVRAQQLIEGRNAAGFGTFNAAPSSRDVMVQSLGN
jgi:hypothetical protein